MSFETEAHPIPQGIYYRERIEVVQKSAVPRVFRVSSSKCVWKGEKQILWTFWEYMTIELIQDDEYDKF